MNRRLSALIPFISALAAAGCSNSIAGAGDTAGAGGAAAGSASTTGGSVGVAGSPVTSGGADVGGGSPTTAGTGAGGDTGGAPMGGSSTGGSTGGGTAPGGAGGTVGAAGGGTAGAPPTITIMSATDGAFNNAFMITACNDAGSGVDCPNKPPGGACDQQTNWSYVGSAGTVSTQEHVGISSDQVFNVTGGDPAKIYDVTVHVEGQAEGRTYVNGVAHSTNVTPAQEKNDMLYTGGQPGPNRTDYNVFQMVITGGTPVPGAPTYYAFNATAQSFEGQHHNYSVDETFTFKVKSGQKLTFTNHDSNCISIKNCGAGGNIYGFMNATDCESHARATPADVTLPATFHGITITNPTHFQTQFLNFKVTSIVAE